MNRGSMVSSLEEVSQALKTRVDAFVPNFEKEEVGRIRSVAQGVVWAEGLSHVQAEELVFLGSDAVGMVLDILPDRVGIILLESGENLSAGDEVTRSGRILEVPVGPAFMGRVVDPMGRPLDDLGPVAEDGRRAVEREAAPIMHRAPVKRPLQTGLKVVDAMIPIGRGQRELILGDRQTGKTAIAVDTIVNQRDKDVLCVYCAIGQRGSSVARVVEDLRQHDAMTNCLVVVVEGDDPPGLQYIAPYAATSMADFFVSRGRDVLIVYDDLTRHARAYRQLSLLLRRPPGREAFPGDIFYIHSRLLERATQYRPEFGGGSLTALPIAETEAQNVSAYIPTNLISITDGQIYLSPGLFQKGILPAVDVGLSVSRVGGNAQLPPYRRVAGDLRLSYSQFQELESFSRFGTRLDERTRQTLEHGHRVREVLKQGTFSPLSAGEQIAILLATSDGLLDSIPLEKMAEGETRIVERLRSDPALEEEMFHADPAPEFWNRLSGHLKKALDGLEQEPHGDP